MRLGGAHTGARLIIQAGGLIAKRACEPGHCFDLCLPSGAMLQMEAADDRLRSLIVFASLALVAAIFAVQTSQASNAGQAASEAQVANDIQVAKDTQSAKQTCVLEGEGWVCRYKAPEGTVTLVPETSAAAAPPPRQREVVSKEAARQAKLVRRCADASWLSLCTPGDRKEAKAIQEANDARAKLRMEVTTLAAHNQCPQAVQAALEGGDLALATEIRDFCAPTH